MYHFRVVSWSLIGLVILSVALIITSRSFGVIALGGVLVSTLALLAILSSNQHTTRRKRPETGLHACEELQRTVMESAADAIVTIDAQSRIVSVNAAAEKIFGYSHNELFQKSFTVLMPERFRERHHAGLQRYLQTGVKKLPWSQIELPGLHKSGMEIPLEISFGEFTRNGHHFFTGVMRDISERKRVERELHASETRYRFLFESIDEGFCVIEVLFDATGVPDDWRLLEANPAFERHTGLRQAVGTRIRELLPIVGARWFDIYGKVALTGEPIRSVEFSQALNRWLNLYAFRIGEPKEHKVAVIFNDITEQRRAANALAESEARFRALAENIPQMAWMTHGDGSALWYNQRWFDYTGTTLEQVRGWRWQMLLHPDHRQRVTEKLKQALGTGQPWEDTFPLRGKDGHYRWFLSRAFPIRERNGSISRWFGTNTDVTELRETQEALRDAQEKLKLHADNLEVTVAQRTGQLRSLVGELEAFSYSLSHDMRAPLRAIQSFTEIAMEECGDNGSEMLSRVITAARRLDHLIQDVLSFTRISRQEIRIQPVDTDRLVREIIAERPELQPPRAEIVIQNPLLPVEGHEASLTQCLTNLLSNAVKFVAGGVKPMVRVYTEAIGGSVRLWVEDNGIGIKREAQDRLFEMFYRINSVADYEGTGIGLAIVRKAAERMAGSVGVESEPGNGSRFWVQLPKAS